MSDKRYAPPSTYVQAGDMTPYWRKDGERPIVVTDSISHFDQSVVLSYLRNYTAKDSYVDYIICSTFQPEFIDTAKLLGIPSLDYEGDGSNGSILRWAIQAFSAQPTKLVLFYHDPLSKMLRQLTTYSEDKNVNVEWISW